MNERGRTEMPFSAQRRLRSFLSGEIRGWWHSWLAFVGTTQQRQKRNHSKHENRTSQSKRAGRGRVCLGKGQAPSAAGTTWRDKQWRSRPDRAWGACLFHGESQNQSCGGWGRNSSRYQVLSLARNIYLRHLCARCLTPLPSFIHHGISLWGWTTIPVSRMSKPRLRGRSGNLAT